MVSEATATASTIRMPGIISGVLNRKFIAHSSFRRRACPGNDSVQGRNPERIMFWTLAYARVTGENDLLNHDTSVPQHIAS
jgi:hypothetical protein